VNDPSVDPAVLHPSQKIAEIGSNQPINRRYPRIDGGAAEIKIIYVADKDVVHSGIEWSALVDGFAAKHGFNFGVFADFRIEVKADSRIQK